MDSESWNLRHSILFCNKNAKQSSETLQVNVSSHNFHALSESSLLSVIQFYCNIMSRSEFGVQHDVERLLSFGDLSPLIRIQSSEELLEFFSKIPELFTVDGKNILLKNWIVFHVNQQEWLKELLSKRHPVIFCPLILCKIQCYCNILFNENPQHKLSIINLFLQKVKAPEFIQSRTRNIRTFTSFLSNYPEIFCITGDSVSLTENAISFKRLDSWIKKLFSTNRFLNYENVPQSIAYQGFFKGKFYESFYDETISNEALGFYYHITLQSYCLNGLPLPTLDSKRMNEAAPEIQILSKNLKELKVFLSDYPEVFIIKDNFVFLTLIKNNVTLKKKLSCPIEGCIDCKNKYKSTIEFYCGVLRDACSNSDSYSLPIENLFVYRVKAPRDVKKKVKYLHELKKLLLKNPNIFKINGDNVSLCEDDMNSSNDSITIISPKNVNNVIKSEISSEEKSIGLIKSTDQSLQNTIFNANTPLKLTNVNHNHNLRSVEASSKCELIKTHRIKKWKTGSSKNKKAILFYSDFIKKQNKQLIPLNSLIGYRSHAPPDVRVVARNPVELKNFFSQYPEIFTVIGDKIMFSKIIEKNKTSSNECAPNNELNFQQANNAADFFLKILHDYGHCRVMSINELFQFKLQSSQNIHEISGSDKQEFVSFLKKFPNHFIVTIENVIGKKKNSKWSFCGKYRNKKFTDPLLVLIYIFFRRYTQNKALLHIDNLFNNAGKYFLYYDNSPIFQSKHDLLLFLALYPHVFYVDSHRVINLVTSSKQAKIFKLRKRRGKKPKEKLVKSPTTINNSNVQNNQHIKECTPSSNGANLGFKNVSNELDVFKKKSRKKKKSPPSTEAQKNDRPSTFDEVCDENKESEIVYNDPDNVCKNKNLYSPENNIHSCTENDQIDVLKLLKVNEIEDMVFAQFTSDYKNPQNGFLHLTAEKSPSDNCKVFGNKGVRCFGLGDFPQSLKERQDLENLVGETLLYLNHSLWKYGPLPILKIEELFQLFIQGSLEITKYYCKNLEEFKLFLSNFPHDFIISKGYIMPNRDLIFGNIYVVNSGAHSVVNMLFNFFNSFTKNNFLSKKHLYSEVAYYFSDINQCQIFKSSEQLVLFLDMFPDIFYVDNNHVRNLSISQSLNKDLKISEEKTYSLNTNQNYPAFCIPESSEGWKQIILNRTRLIEDINQCKLIAETILKYEEVIALDCEGANLGAYGTLTLIQIGLKNGQIFIFDIYKDRSMIEKGGLKAVLESESIVKVIHDSRNDAANLFIEYDVEIIKIFDTRIANHLIMNSGINNKKQFIDYNKIKLTAIGFNNLCIKYDAPINIEKDEMKNVYRINPLFWTERPLTNDMKAYAALDVAPLVQIYEKMLQEISDDLLALVWDMSLLHSISSRP